MKSLTEVILDHGKESLESFEAGIAHGNNKKNSDQHKQAITAWSEIRVSEGLGNSSPNLLTEPSANLKLGKGVKPSYGLTLQHYVSSFRDIRLTVNACPHAGDCTKMCVLDSGHGSFPVVQLARRAKTKFFAVHPKEAMFLLGHDLQKAINKDTEILFRPNVNSDVEWEKVLPPLVNGKLFGDTVLSYGYTKIPDILDTDGWPNKKYRVSYSYNENSPDWDIIKPFLDRGGSVAVVTNRKAKAEIKQWSDVAEVVDADTTDEWMFKPGVIGDLSAKGKARKLVGSTDFIQQVYGDKKQ